MPATVHQAETLQLLQGGQALFPALIKALDGAQRWVQLETYIFDFHGVGTDLAYALARAAGRGVQVQVLVDGLGSDDLNTFWQSHFQQSGVQWCVYSPVGVGWRLLSPERWRRLHRKLCVVDERTVFCGGINVLDDFYDPQYGVLPAPRFDFAVSVTGPMAQEASAAMALLWWRVQAGYSARRHHMLAAWHKFKAASAGQAGSDSHLTPSTRAALSAASRVRLVLRDNLRHRHSIERAYRQAIGRARQEIIIANAYFLPGGKLRRALIAAARRGVRVTLLLQGKYEYFLQYHAVRPVYAALLSAGVEIHEYEASFLHAKVAVIDEQWATVGSSNLDPLSLLLAREANMVVQDPAFARELRSRLQQAIMRHGRCVDPIQHAQRPLGQRMRDLLAYALMRLALLLMGQQRY